MTQQERRDMLLQAVVLLGLAMYFAVNILSGSVTNYINMRFVWLSYVAVLIFAALGLASLYALRAGNSFNRGDDHQPVNLPIIMVMAIPLVLGTLIPSQPLGAEAIDGAVSFNAFAGLNAAVVQKDPLERDVLDWARVFTADKAPGTFNGQQADIIGFVYTEPTYPQDTVMVARFTVSCCVADASPIGLPVYWPDADTLESGQWVRVSGAFEARDFRGQLTPTLIADAVTLTEQPEHPYLYP